MRIMRVILSLFILSIVSASAWAIDYRPDETFNANLANHDVVQSAYVQPDGKVIIGGVIALGSGGRRPFVKRINPDGSTDPAFNVSMTSSGDGLVSSIRPVAGGKFLITGSFTVNSTFTYYARFNSDGSLDTSMPLSNRNHISDMQPDGKLLACTTVNFQSFFPIRLNTNGTVDPTFDITFVDDVCPRMRALPNGKIIINADFTINGQPAEPLYRVNSDGSQDPTFDAPFGVGRSVTLLSILPDSKIMVRSSAGIFRLFPDGPAEVGTDGCQGDFVLPLADGNYFMTECRRTPDQLHRFVRVLADGNIDPTFDHIETVLHELVSGLQPDGNGGYYVYGGLIRMRDVTTYGIGRIVPDTSRLKAKYDFDGDGKSDMAVYRPSNGYWYVIQSSGGQVFFQWGLPGDRPAAAHFDRDGKTDFAIYRPGEWQAFSSSQGHKYMYIGQAGDKPIAGYFDSYLRENAIAVSGLRNGVTTWFIRSGYNFVDGFPVPNVTLPPIIVSGQTSSDKPVTGDFNADGREDIGYFRDGLWYTADYKSYLPPQSFQWGSAGDIPVPEDYDGDRQTDYAVFRPSTGVWWVLLSSGGYRAIQFGQNGDIPVPADYDGDGKADIAVYRNGIWWEYLSASGTVGGGSWGLADDIPIPAQFQ